jgi:hypothetical protein
MFFLPEARGCQPACCSSSRCGWTIAAAGRPLSTQALYEWNGKSLASPIDISIDFH